MRISAIQEAQDLYKKFKSGVGNVANKVGSFVKQNPLPVAYANQQFQNRVAQPVAQRVANTPVMPFIPQVTAKSYTQGQIVNPIRQGVQQIQQPGILNKAMGAGSIVGGAMAATPQGALFNVGQGFASGIAQSIRQKQNPQQTIASSINKPTSFASTGLGINNGAVALGVDLFTPSIANKGAAIARAKGLLNVPGLSKIEGALADSKGFFDNVASTFQSGVSGSDRKKVITELAQEAKRHAEIFEMSPKEIERSVTASPEAWVKKLQEKSTLFLADRARATSYGVKTNIVNNKPISSGGEIVRIKDPNVSKLLNDNSDFGVVFKRQYEGHIRQMESGVLSPPISGVNKGKNVIDESLAKQWALRDVMAMGEETRARMAKSFRSGEIGGIVKAKTPKDILQSISSGDNGLPGRMLDKSDQNVLSEYLKKNGSDALRGKVTEGPNGTRDIIFGTIKDRQRKGQTEYLVMADSGPYKGAFRLHSTPIDSKFFGTKIVSGEIPKGVPEGAMGFVGNSPQASQKLPSTDTQTYLKELTQKQNTAREAGTKTGTIRRIYNEIKKKFVDSTAPIEDALSMAEKKGKFQVRPEGDVRLQIDRVLRSPTLAGQFAKDNGLTDIVRNTDDLNALDQYMIAKHAATIEKTGRKTGRDLVKDQKLIQDLGPQYEQAAQKVTAYSRKLLDYSVETGLISKKLADKLKIDYPEYVPLQRIFDETEKSVQGTGRGVASLSKQSVVQKLKGSERDIESPIASLLAKTNDAFAQGERNIAGKQLASYKDLPGFEGLITELKGNATGKHTFSFIDNGVKRTFETTPEIEAAAKSLDRQQLGFLGNLLSFQTRLLRLGATGLNIPFVGANIVKDQLTGFINSNQAAKTSLLNPANFLRAMWSAGKHDELYDEMVRAGAGGTSFDIGRQNVPDTIAKIRSTRGVGDKLKYIASNPIRSAGDLITELENLIGRSEELGRLQQFRGTKQALQGTRTATDATLLAADAARKNTANFARSGDWGKVLNLIIPYFNAGIQGSRATMQALQKNPVGTSAKIAVGLFTPVAAATMWNLSDPERKKVYDDIDDYEKENNIILILDPSKPLEKGRYGGVIKIPIQQGFGGLSTGVRQGIEQAYGSSPAKIQDIASGLIQFGTSLNVGSPRELVSSFTPQALKVPIETATNTNLFTGKQVVPQYMLNKPKEEQVFDSTSGTARKIGGKLNTSPLTVQNAVSTSLGGVGRQVLNASDTVLNKLGKIPESQIGGQSVAEATANRFNSVSGGKKLDEAYAAKDVRDNAKRQALQAYLSGDKEKAMELKKEHGFSISKEDIKRSTTNQKNKATELYIEGKKDQAMELKKKYNLTINKDDIQKSAKRKAVELYKLGLKDQAMDLKKQYGFSISQQDVAL